MKTSDLAVGTHVAYDYNENRDSHTFVEAYVIAHRPRGNNSSYYGSNGNHDTVGIAFINRWERSDYPPIRFKWVRPQTLHMTWDEHQEMVASIDKRRKEYDKARKAEVKNRRTRVAALPVEVLSLFKPHQIESLRDRDFISTTLNVDFIERLVKAAQDGHPSIKNDRIASEVEAALALLG